MNRPLGKRFVRLLKIGAGIKIKRIPLLDLLPIWQTGRTNATISYH